MTQSGQGEEPSARQAREGIVLPSDGGEPLLPGMTGRPTPVPATPPTTPPPSAPPGGQAWGTPWGPEQPATPPPAAPGQAWGAQPGQSWGGQEQQYQAQAPAPWGAAPEGGAYGGGVQGAPPSTPSYGQGAPAGPSLPAPQPPYGQSGGPSSTPLPPAGGQAYGAPGGNAPLPPAGAQAYGTPGSAAEAYGAPGSGGALPPAQQGGPGAPLPPAAPLPQAGAGAGGFGAPLPPADEGATQYIPPVSAAPAGADDQATRFIPPVGAAGTPPASEGATQYIPPVGPGALPPEVSNESTQILGRARQGGGAGPMPQASGPDADATQYIPPVPGQAGGAPHGGPQRQPLSDFDNLFRSEPGGEPPAASTQQLPRFQQPPQPQGRHEGGYFPPGANGPHSPYGPGDDDGGRGGRTGSRLPLIAAVGVGIAVLGIGAGALLAGGGGDDEKDDNSPVSATAPATEGSSSPSADPAEEQAVALDKLLADSGDSRTSVINAVDDVKSCDNLAQAAKDLRDAAGQRNRLVTDLSKLEVDQLPNHTELTTALTKAWQASASADNHYAAWADQVAGNQKLCKKGQARSTGQTQAGNRASGTASTQKKSAAQLWNTIAKKYGLTERQPTQL
ncbi:hypothetical protein EJ357_20140 [Streptomyces cyaneochromogenes]|uniref:Uncharacterized protein n=1 Tax=Streptomyces cyaneochromogenes TaxID=2496836 RepID=A0A3Q9ET27_9ACTN|nr:hypothetical protein [Streptomyces cyaneochromogenes]AZQ35521.1 hypothetical protein EJ357_20140 [Streptomyces cyaneochromogenes]